MCLGNLSRCLVRIWSGVDELPCVSKLGFSYCTFAGPAPAGGNCRGRDVQWEKPFVAVAGGYAIYLTVGAWLFHLFGHARVSMAVRFVTVSSIACQRYGFRVYRVRIPESSSSLHGWI